MPVNTPQISVDPYRSQVPLVQIPQQDLQQPQQQGGIYSKAGGIATLADGAMKGLLRGLQLKEQKKYETANAVMNAQDAAIGDAKKQYQDALMTKGKDDSETQAKWGAYTKTVNDAADARQAYAIPEKTPKQPKGQKRPKTAADGAPASGGFGAGIKQLLERNPHILPELAIIGMRSQVDPKLYGQMTPEVTAQKQQMDAAQRQEANQKVIDTARGTYDKYAGRANLTPQEQDDFENAKAVLTPITPNQKFQVLLDPQGQQHNVPVGTEIPAGWKVYEKPLASQVARAGTEQEFTSQALKGYGYTNDTAPPDLLKYLHSEWSYRQPQTASTTSGSTQDVAGNRTTTTNTTRGTTAPKPPSGFAPLGEDGQPLKEAPKAGKMTAPPVPGGAAAAAPRTGRGAMTPPPGSEGRPTLTQANRTQKYLNESDTAYAKAHTAYQTALDKIRSAAHSNNPLAPEEVKSETERVTKAYEEAKAQIVLQSAAKIKAIGGNPWKATANNGQYGTMDGVNWVSTQTGYAYQEK